MIIEAALKIRLSLSENRSQTNLQGILLVAYLTNPTITAWEIKLTTNPKFNSPSIKRIIPERNVRLIAKIGSDSDSVESDTSSGQSDGREQNFATNIDIMAVGPFVVRNDLLLIGY